MSYYSNFTLNVYDWPEGSKNVEYGRLVTDEYLKIAVDNAIQALDVFEEGNMRSGYYAYAPWSTVDEDMCELSRKFPTVLFELNGNGDDWDDIWVTYYLDGKMQFCPAAIVYPDFDPDGFKEYQP